MIDIKGMVLYLGDGLKKAENLISEKIPNYVLNISQLCPVNWPEKIMQKPLIFFYPHSYSVKQHLKK